MPCDDLTAALDGAPGMGDAVAAIAARRQPGRALRQLEAAAQDELRRMLAARGHAAPGSRIADPVWAGLAWDMGLNGAAIAAAGAPAQAPGYTVLPDDD
ncbi:hypothetical protein [Xanthomonas theicola]|uniref:Uncharacterized protein n=1 Tax=Xanthomonas theicola TaxID=56464 RepID=A0A2S6ZM53_9XANT|nr:hypothetical protein [Xanthomonas theicola]PPT93324.1 hypothetical protein XthCFBP4691_00135 [Xanthomonas theicola]QNH24522.1 hypothetical protein G4Q83_06840 [Xanthomonas theicola]